MDWARENSGIDERDFAKVWKYQQGNASIVRCSSTDSSPVVIPIDQKDAWDDFRKKELQFGEQEISGLFLMLATRTTRSQNVSQIDGLGVDIEKASLHESSTDNIRAHRNCKAGNFNGPSQRDLRVLPISYETFKSVSKSFCIHGSIARVINRADVAMFSRVYVEMENPFGQSDFAYVYNSRTSNAWGDDVALTVTHFPHLDLTFAILFGCTKTVERDVIKRLARCNDVGSTPMLLVGIVAEIERRRQIRLVEDMMDVIEDTTFHVNEAQNGKIREFNEAKRNQWLETAFLKNSLINWSAHLTGMIEHMYELEADTTRETQLARGGNHLVTCVTSRATLVGGNDEKHAADDFSENYSLFDELAQAGPRKSTMVTRCDTMFKIRDRLKAILNEYEEKIRECDLRLSGMTMTIQFIEGDTNVDIAVATGRDSRQMRSIAIVTMIFLPGTFFASMFSMTFFTWDDGATVSPYFWVYALLTIATTIITLGSWYYMSVRNGARKEETTDEESLIP